MSGGLKTILPMAALGATGFGLAGMGPLAGILGSGAGAAGAGAAGAGEAAGAGLLGNAFGSADMLAANSLGGGMSGLAAPLAGTAESMGADFINGVPQNFGARLSSLKNGLMPGEWDWMKGGKMGLEGLKMMEGDKPQPQNMNVQNSMPAPRQPMMQNPKSFFDIAKDQMASDEEKKKAWLMGLGG